MRWRNFLVKCKKFVAPERTFISFSRSNEQKSKEKNRESAHHFSGLFSIRDSRIGFAERSRIHCKEQGWCPSAIARTDETDQKSISGSDMDYQFRGNHSVGDGRTKDSDFLKISNCRADQTVDATTFYILSSSPYAGNPLVRWEHQLLVSRG